MKKITLLLLSVVLILTFACSCKEAEEQTLTYKYRIDDFEYFSELFNKKELSGLEGNYEIEISGLDTDVVVSMEGMKVLTVSAYDKTIEVNIATYQDYCPAQIEGAKDAVIVSEDLDYNNRCWIITKDKAYTLLPEGDISVRVFANGGGSLGYRRYWGEYVTSFEQWDTAPLDLSKGRDQFLYEEGTAQILDGRLILTPEKTVELQDEYDVDAIFESAKANGMYEEYENADKLFKANAQKGLEG